MRAINKMFWSKVPPILLAFCTLAFLFIPSEATKNVASCQDLNTADTVYVLVNDVLSDGTCFTIGASNITLDGQGHTVTYANRLRGYAINKSSGYYNYVAIKNLNIVQGNSSISGAHAIYTPEMDGYIENNKIKTSGYAFGIFRSESRVNHVLGNFIISGVGIFISESGLNIISNNTIMSSSGGIGIGGSYTNFVSNNLIKTSGKVGIGINIYASSTNTILNNTITTDGDGAAHGIAVISGSVSNVISYNNVATSGRGSSGIYISSDKNSISNNKVSTSNEIAPGIILEHSDLNIISSNNITTSGIGSFGAFFMYSDRNVLSNNDFATSGPNSFGISFLVSGNNTVSNNSIAAADSGIVVGSSVANTFSNNDIATSNISTYGLYFENSSSTLLSNNIVMTPGDKSRGIYLDRYSRNTILRNNNVTTSGGKDSITTLPLSAYFLGIILLAGLLMIAIRCFEQKNLKRPKSP